MSEQKLKLLEIKLTHTAFTKYNLINKATPHMIISSNPSRCIHQFFHDKPRELIVDQRLHPLRINLNLNFQTSRLGRKYMTAILKRRLIEACHVRKSNSIHGDSTWDGGRGIATEAT